MLTQSGGMRNITMPNFFQNWSIQSRDIAIFQFFKMAGDAILDFQICKISLADSVWKAQTHHRARCRQNWSSVVETLQFFEFSKWPPAPSWIFEIATFYWLLWLRGSRHICMPNFVKIGQSVAKILRFFSFFMMAAAAILDCRIHKILLTDRVRTAQTHVLNFIKIGHSIAAILRFCKFFKMAATPSWMFEILKFYWLLW